MPHLPSDQSPPLKEKLAVALLKLSAKLPLSVIHALGKCIGQLAYWSRGRMYAVTRENLEICFPDQTDVERAALTKASMIETCKMMLEIGAVWLRDYEWVKSKVLKVHGLSILEQALEEEKGVILLAPHLGNWEVLGLYLSEVAPITCLYQPPEMSLLEPIMRNSREKVGAKIVPTTHKGVVVLLKTMKAGGFTGILPDQVPDEAGGEFAPFYGVPALTMTLVNNLQRRSGCLVVAGYAERVKGGFEIHFKTADASMTSEDLGEALAAMNRTVESCVNDIPAQYQWEYKRFRKQPQGMPKRYKK